MRSKLFKNIFVHQTPLASEQGTALLELAIVVPVYVLILFSLVDLGQATRNHNIFEQVASNVGANVLARIADLEPNSWYQNVQTGSSTGCSPSNDCPGHRLVHDLVNRLRTLYGFDVGTGEEFSSFSVRTRYLPFAWGTPNSDVVQLEMNGIYAGVLPTLSRTLSVKVEYPYLYDDVPHGGFSPMPPKTPIDLPGLSEDDREVLEAIQEEAQAIGGVAIPVDASDDVIVGAPVKGQPGGRPVGHVFGKKEKARKLLRFPIAP